MNLPGLNWGATPAERATTLPCDALAPDAPIRADRAISISAPPQHVFAWLCQLRLAPYSYDLLDNWGRRSPDALEPGLTELQPGLRFMTIFELVSFEQDVHLTLRAAGAVVTYALKTKALTPQTGGTRLHVRVLFPGSRWIGYPLACGDLVMMRKQLLTLKSLAERPT